MAAVMIGVDPHKASHTAVAFDAAEEPPGQLRVRASAVQADRLLAWAAAWPQRTWAVEGAGGTGHLLAQQLLAAGEVEGWSSVEELTGWGFAQALGLP
jgi:transposase